MSKAMSYKVTTPVLSKGPTTLAEGMVMEGSAHWGNMLPDILVDAEAVKTITDQVNEAVADDMDADQAITVVQKVVRLLLAEQHPAKVAAFCKAEMELVIASDHHTTLSKFLKHSIGDCRMNALALGIGMNVLAERRLIKNVRFENRKWGFARSKEYPTEEVGHQGDHTLITFEYMRSAKRFTADAFALAYDRIPVGAVTSPDVRNTWYKVLDTRAIAQAHNVFGVMVKDGSFAGMKACMSREGAARFICQATVFEEHKVAAWAYLSTPLDYPKFAKPS